MGGGTGTGGYESDFTEAGRRISEVRIADIWSDLPEDHPLRDCTVSDMMDGTAHRVLFGNHVTVEEGEI